MEEIWKDKKDYEEHYQVSNCGRVKSIKFGKEKILKLIKDKEGYLQVTLCKNNIKTIFFVHRLVAEAFLEIPEELRHLEGTRYLQVNHKDENKLNNNVDNLEWCTNEYNINYGTRTERCSKPVLQYTLDGEFVREWPSIMECGRNGYIQQAISACCRKDMYRHTHKGYRWEYKK